MVRIILLLILILPVSVSAACIDPRYPRTYKSVLSGLYNRYKEVPVVRGLTSNSLMIETYGSRDGSTWTIIVTTAKGCSRTVGSGIALELLKWKAPAKRAGK